MVSRRLWQPEELELGLDLQGSVWKGTEIEKVYVSRGDLRMMLRYFVGIMSLEMLKESGC